MGQQNAHVYFAKLPSPIFKMEILKCVGISSSRHRYIFLSIRNFKAYREAANEYTRSGTGRSPDCICLVALSWLFLHFTSSHYFCTDCKDNISRPLAVFALLHFLPSSNRVLKVLMTSPASLEQVSQACSLIGRIGFHHRLSYSFQETPDANMVHEHFSRPPVCPFFWQNWYSG